MYGTRVNIEPNAPLSPTGDEQQEDFFAQEFPTSDDGHKLVVEPPSLRAIASDSSMKDASLADPSAGPKVDHLSDEHVPAQEGKSLILKKPIKTARLGAKKGIGAQKIKANFTELEEKANEFDKERETFANLSMNPETTKDEEDGAPKLSSKFLIQNEEKKVRMVLVIASIKF